MQFSRIPFFIVVLASFLPLAAAGLDSKSLTFAPEILSFLAFLLLMMKNPIGTLWVSKGLLAILVYFSFHSFYAVLSGKGVGSFGILSLVFSTFIFLALLRQGNERGKVEQIYKQITIIYVIHIFGIVFELLFRLSWGTDVLDSYFGIAAVTAEIAKYKLYNSATLLRYLGFDMTGLNSLLLGSQVASQLILFAVFVFAPFYKDLAQSKKLSRVSFWFVLSALMFPFVATMTANLILVVFFIVFLFFLPNSRFRSFKFQISLFLIIVIFFEKIVSLILFRIRNSADLTEYLTTFLDPLLTIRNLSTLDILLGYGRNFKETGVEHGDFGLGMLTLQSGLLTLLVSLYALIFITFRGFFLIHKRHLIGGGSGKWSTLLSINIICTIGWFVSLVHYTPAVELGGRHLFAFHISICLYIISVQTKVYQINRIDFQSFSR